MSEHPPVYNSVPTSENAEAPPSYFNIMAQLKDAKANSTGTADVIKSSASIIAGSFITTCCLLVYLIVPITQFVIGIQNQNSCTIQPNIPLWLIVAGAVSSAYILLKAIIQLIDFIQKRKNPTQKNKVSLLLNCIVGLIGIFNLVWFILGNYWVYSVYAQVQYDALTDPATYCDKLVYLFSFWLITASWIFLGLFCVCFCGILCVIIGCSVKAASNA